MIERVKLFSPTHFKSGSNFKCGINGRKIVFYPRKKKSLNSAYLFFMEQLFYRLKHAAEYCA